jgi:hypothetical protein
MVALPEQTQFSPIFNISKDDFDRDGAEELILTGNFSATKPEEGRYDANTGLLLKIENQFNMKVFETAATGLSINGDVRNVGIIRTTDNKKLLIVARNSDNLEFYEY